MRVLFMAMLLAGCAEMPKKRQDASSRAKALTVLQRVSWTPTCSERTHAEKVARNYAAKNPTLSQAHLARMKTDFIGLRPGEGVRELIIQFYDPSVFRPRPDGSFEMMHGGFPHYFTITMNPETWKVINHYESRQ